MFGSAEPCRSNELSSRRIDKLTELILAKLDEQIKILTAIVKQVPAGRSSWTPELPLASFPERRSLGAVLGHLLQCLAGFVAVLYAAHPEHLDHFLKLKERPVNHTCEPDEALHRIEEYRRSIRAGFLLLDDSDLARIIPTVFVPEGESVLTLLLGNLEHLANHKHELFFYVKLLGVPLTSRHLYLFRGEFGKSAHRSDTVTEQ